MSLSRDILLTKEDIEKYCEEQEIRNNNNSNNSNSSSNNNNSKLINFLIEHWEKEFRPIYQKIDEANLS